MDENLDCLKLLQNIATEQNFELIYIPIEQRGKNGKTMLLSVLFVENIDFLGTYILF